MKELVTTVVEPETPISALIRQLVYVPASDIKEKGVEDEMTLHKSCQKLNKRIEDCTMTIFSKWEERWIEDSEITDGRGETQAMSTELQRFVAEVVGSRLANLIQASHSC